MECIVEFEYEANEDDELTLNKGDIISNVSLYEDGWMKGVLRGKEGVFPDNFVKIIKQESKMQEKHEQKSDALRKSQEDLASSKKTPNSSNAGVPAPGQKARVVHKYVPRQKDELALELGAIVDILDMKMDEEDDGWLRGSCNGKVGVFPANFVVPVTPVTNRRHNTNASETNETPHTTGPRKVVGVGFGNIFTGEPIQLKTTSVKEVKRDTEDPNQAPKFIPRPNRSGTSPNVERVIVKYPYKSENPDELTIEKGDIISIIDKNLEDDGWWKGELNGKIGVFPDNFVEAYPIGSSAVKDDKSKPSRPAPPLPSDKPNPPEKLGNSKKTGPPPIVAKKPSSKSSTNGKAESNKGDSFDNLPDHQPLQTLTSDRPRVANKRLPSKEFFRASAEEATAEKEEEKIASKRGEHQFIEPPPPRPSHRPNNPIQTPAPSINSSSTAPLPKTSTIPLQSKVPVAMPTPAASQPVEPLVTPAHLTELRRIFDNRMTQEISEVRSEMERMRSTMLSRIHSLTAEIDEEKRMRHSAQVELERVRRLLQERELTPVAPGGSTLPHQSHSSA